MEEKLRAALLLLKELGLEELYLSEAARPPSEEKKEEQKVKEPQTAPSSREEKDRLLRELYEKNKDCCRCDLCHSRT